MEHIIVAVITSLTTITVTLISAGYFRKFMDARYQSGTKRKLMGQIKKDEIVHYTIEEIKNQYEADRVYLIQFHNGGTFYTNSPMQKASITYERTSDGLERLADNMTNFFVSHYTSMIKDTIENKLFYTDIEHVQDIATKALLRKSSTHAVAAIPIYDKGSSKFCTPNGNLIGILVLDWVFSHVPHQYVKDNADATSSSCCFTHEFKEQLLKNGESISNSIV